MHSYCDNALSFPLSSVISMQVDVAFACVGVMVFRSYAAMLWFSLDFIPAGMWDVGVEVEGTARTGAQQCSKAFMWG